MLELKNTLMAHYVVRFARHAGVAALFITAALLGSLSGVMFAYAGDLPQISALDNYAPSTITRVYAAGGEVVGEFAIQRRLVVGYDDIAPRLRQAIIATEDAEFDRHVGLSFPRMLAAAARDIIEWRRAQGASTLTQQLARNLFLTPDKSLERKIKEAILTIQMEKRYTKREIFTLYANQVIFGHGAYGVEAAARLYFNKPAKDVNLEEAALIAGIIQRPARQSPYVDLNAALRRRNYSLQRMADVGDISQADADAAKKRPIIVRGQPQPDRSIAPFFVEEVRKYLEQTYGAKQLYEAGLSVRTTLDVGLQEAANRAIDHGLRQLDKRRGYRKDKPTVLGQGRTLEGYHNARWGRPIAPQDIVPAVVISVAPAGARLRIAEPLPRICSRSATSSTYRFRSWTRPAARPSCRWNRHPWSKARCWRSTITRGRSGQWWAASTSSAANSTAPRRRTARWDRHSSRSCTRRPSTAAIRRLRNWTTPRRRLTQGPGSRRTRRRTTTASTKA
jgi:penicillin-binding protein 1A